MNVEGVDPRGRWLDGVERLKVEGSIREVAGRMGREVEGRKGRSERALAGWGREVAGRRGRPERALAGWGREVEGRRG